MIGWTDHTTGSTEIWIAIIDAITMMTIIEIGA